MFELHPKTKKLLELFSTAPYGEEFSYAKILQVTGCDLRDGDYGRLVTIRNRLERDHRRTLTNMRGRGYKVANPPEFADSMRVRSGKAKRQMVLARRTGDATPLELLSDSEARDLTDQMVFNSRVVNAFKYQSAWNSKQDERIAALEVELKRLRKPDEPPIEGDAVEEDSA